MLMNATGYKALNVVQQVVMLLRNIDPWMLGPTLGLRLWRLGLVQSRPTAGENVVTE